ncbi:hypothetical protein D9M71_804710 [compost metagenome]
MVTLPRCHVASTCLAILGGLVQELGHGIEVQIFAIRGKPFGELLHFGHVHITSADVLVLRGVVL